MNLICEKTRKNGGVVPTGYTYSIREPVADTIYIGIQLHSNKRWFKKNVKVIKIPNQRNRKKKWMLLPIARLCICPMNLTYVYSRSDN